MPIIETTLYYANWCGHCTEFKPLWDDFEKKIEKFNSRGHNLTIIAKKYEDSELEKEGITPTINGVNIRGYPTVSVTITDKKGKKIEYEYSGKRDTESLYDYITKEAVNKLKETQ